MGLDVHIAARVAAAAWGTHNQTVVVLLAAQAENSWARHVWHQEAEHQRHTPTAA